MPLIVITGYPSSGKTRCAMQLKNHFESHGKEVYVVSEMEQIVKAGFEKNNFYTDSRKEKDIRSALKSEVIKLISPKNIVILDGSNYIKGYRYELYCATKANHSTQCTVYTVISKDLAWKYNEECENDAEKYEREVFDGLVYRYEEPNGKNRWDAPLFLVTPDAVMDIKGISDSLFEKKAPPPNMSTQNPPLSDTNYLFDMNKITKDITTKIIGMLSCGCTGEKPIRGYTNLKIDLTNLTVPKLISLNKQYLTYSKMHTPDINQVPLLYIQYLKTNMN